ncbi:MAG: arginine--tRNA ligase [archaeon]
MYIQGKIKESIQRELEEATGLKVSEKDLDKPPESSMGDFSTTIAFKYAEERSKKPVEAAKEIKGKINPELIEEIQVKGPYINFYIDREKYYSKVLEEAKKEKYGSSGEGKGKTIIVEYSSPNVAKPFHIGHLRSTILGQSLKNIYERLGYNTVAVNHLGDWGTQFGKIITAYDKWGKPDKLKEDPIEHLYGLYVKFHEEAEKNLELEDEAREHFKNLEDGKKEEEELWNKFRELSIEKFKETYNRLGVDFDEYKGEAHYVKSGEAHKVVEESLEKNVAKEEKEGAVVIPLEEHGLTNLIIQKEDGATIYSTRDLAAAKDRWKEHEFHRNLYVVGSEQNLHFKQLFKTLEMLGYEWSEKCEHVSYGLVDLPEGSMSTRKGKIIKLEDVLNEAQKRSMKAIEEKNPDLEEKEETSDEVGKAAIIFTNLNQKRNKNIKFEWGKALDFEGDTGPYLQYAHARASGIIKEVKGELLRENNIQKLVKNNELNPETGGLIKKLSEFPEKIKKAKDKRETQEISKYLLELTHKFTKFYQKCPVKHAETEELKKTRLETTKAFKNTLGQGLKLLQITPLEEM